MIIRIIDLKVTMVFRIHGLCIEVLTETLQNQERQ